MTWTLVGYFPKRRTGADPHRRPRHHLSPTCPSGSLLGSTRVEDLTPRPPRHEWRGGVQAGNVVGKPLWYPKSSADSRRRCRFEHSLSGTRTGVSSGYLPRTAHHRIRVSDGSPLGSTAGEREHHLTTSTIWTIFQNSAADMAEQMTARQ